MTLIKTGLFLFLFTIAYFSLGSLSAMEISNRTMEDFKKILSANESYDDGSIIFVTEPNKTAEILDYINERRLENNLEPVQSENGELVMLTGGAARQFYYQFSRIVGFPKNVFGREFPNQYIVFTDRLASSIMKFIAKTTDIFSKILNAEIAFIVGSLKRTLTYEIVNAVANQKIAWYALVLVPFAWVIDHVKVLVSTAGLILTATVTGAVLAIEYTIFAIVKLVEMVGTGIVKVVKWVLDKLKPKEALPSNSWNNEFLRNNPLTPRWQVTRFNLLIDADLTYIN